MCRYKWALSFLFFDVQIHRTNGQWYWAEYSTFSISDEGGKYQLMVSGYSGDAGDALAAAQAAVFIGNGMMFSTPDSDSDTWPGGSCATAGWWFNWCSTSPLNRDVVGMWTTGTPIADVQASRMLVKGN